MIDVSGTGEALLSWARVRPFAPALNNEKASATEYVDMTKLSFGCSFAATRNNANPKSRSRATVTDGWRSTCAFAPGGIAQTTPMTATASPPASRATALVVLISIRRLRFVLFPKSARVSGGSHPAAGLLASQP